MLLRLLKSWMYLVYLGPADCSLASPSGERLGVSFNSFV